MYFLSCVIPIPAQFAILSRNGRLGIINPSLQTVEKLVPSVNGRTTLKGIPCPSPLPRPAARGETLEPREENIRDSKKKTSAF